MTPEMTRWFRREDAHDAMKKGLDAIEKAIEDFRAHLTDDEVQKLRSKLHPLRATVSCIGGDEG